MTFTAGAGDKERRQRLPLLNFYANPFREQEILTFEVQDPWIKEVGKVAVAGYRVVTVGSTAVGRKRGVQAPMGFYIDPDDLRKLMFADFPEYVHSGEPIEHPLVAAIPQGILGAGSLIVRHTGSLRDGDIPMHLKDHVEIEAYRRRRALQALDALGYRRDAHAQTDAREFLT